MPNPPRDRFDDIPPSPHRVGAHRAENPRVRGVTTFLWALGATIVLVAVGIVGSLIVRGDIDLFPEPAPTIVPTETPEAVVDTSYSVLILNGTPEAGLATQTKDLLLTEGWTEDTVIASNASSRDFPETIVYYTTEEAESAARGLAGLIGADRVTLDPEYPLPGTPATQLTVVLGTDLLPTPDPTTTP